MLYRIQEAYIEAGSERSAFLKYAGYLYDSCRNNFGDATMTADENVIKIAKTPAREYFMPIFEKVKEKYSNAYFDEDAWPSDITLVLDGNNKGQKVALTLISEETKGVYCLGVGLYDDGGSTYTILLSPPDSDVLFADIAENAEKYFRQL